MKKIRIGIVGRGFGKHVHAPAFARDHRCEVVAISGERGWRALVADPLVDAVSIAVPPLAQPAVALAAMRNGKAVFCEKPLCVSLSQAVRLAGLSRRLNIPSMVDFEFPEIPEWRKAKALLDGGAVGRLRHVAVSWNLETYANQKRLQSWKTRTGEGGGALYNFASHSFYYLEWLCGKIERLSAKLSHAADLPGKGDTLVFLALGFASGASGVVSISTHAFMGGGHRLEFYGDRGTLLLENPTRDYVKGFRLMHAARGSKAFQRIRAGAELIRDKDGRIWAVARMATRFLDAVSGGRAAKPSLREAVRVQELLETARRSARKGITVRC